MPKHSSHILELARLGARHRCDELVSEINTLVRQFPVLEARARQATRPGRGAVVSAAAELQPSKRRKLSAAARKAISDAQKARWAKQRSATAEIPTRKAGKKR
jgi:hypothetical protein